MTSRYRPATVVDRYKIDTVAVLHRPCILDTNEALAELIEYGGGRGWRCLACGASWKIRVFALFTGAELAERFVVRVREDAAEDVALLVWRTEGKVRFVKSLAPGEVALDGDVPFASEPPG